MFGNNPVLEYVVDVEPVSATNVDHPPPTGDSRSILYPVIADPPLSAGAVHDRLICDDDIAVALNAVGTPGTVADVVAFAALDADPAPIAFIAETL